MGFANWTLRVCQIAKLAFFHHLHEKSEVDILLPYRASMNFKTVNSGKVGSGKLPMTQSVNRAPPRYFKFKVGRYVGS